jgi:hypothetical protein
VHPPVNQPDSTLAARLWQDFTAMGEGGYLRIGGVLGLIAGILTFFGCWIYCIAAYGFFLGVGLGWLPSGIIAAIVGFAVMLLWAPALLLIAVGLIFILKH